MRKPAYLYLAGAALIGAPLAAQTTTTPAATAAPPAVSGGASVAAGATVYDTKDGVAGTIESVSNGVAVISTGANKVGLPLTSFAVGPKGPVIAMTKAELDAAAGQAASQAAADLKAQLAAGATVYGKAGASLGTVKEADDQFVTLNAAKGPVKLPITAFSKGDKGAVLAMTAAELDAALAAAGVK